MPTNRLFPRVSSAHEALPCAGAKGWRCKRKRRWQGRTSRTDRHLKGHRRNQQTPAGRNKDYCAGVVSGGLEIVNFTSASAIASSTPGCLSSVAILPSYVNINISSLGGSSNLTLNGRFPPAFIPPTISHSTCCIPCRHSVSVLSIFEPSGSFIITTPSPTKSESPLFTTSVCKVGFPLSSTAPSTF